MTGGGKRVSASHIAFSKIAFQKVGDGHAEAAAAAATTAGRRAAAAAAISMGVTNAELHCDSIPFPSGPLSLTKMTPNFCLKLFLEFLTKHGVIAAAARRPETFATG